MFEHLATHMPSPSSFEPNFERRSEVLVGTGRNWHWSAGLAACTGRHWALECRLVGRHSVALGTGVPYVAEALALQCHRFV